VGPAESRSVADPAAGVRSRTAPTQPAEALAVIGQAGGRITAWNDGAEALYGYSAAEAVGQPVSLLSRDTAANPQSGDGRPYETSRRCKDGRALRVLVRQTLLSDAAGARLGTISIEQDVTASQTRAAALESAREQAEAANRTKSEFVANISHELRTPMNAILGMIDLVRRSPQLPAALHDYLATAHDASQSMLVLVNDLLDFSRLDVGKLELTAAPFSLRDTFDEVLRVLALKARAGNIELACHVASDVPDDLVGDGRRLRQIVMNLVGNAVKFTPSGEVVLHAQVESLQGRQLRLRISVSDSGIGVPEELRERIFEPFTQVDASDTRSHAGSGLGLTISRKIAALMGGRLWCEPNQGPGTTFHCLVDLQVRKERPGLPPATADHLRGKSVLIVEGHAATRQILAEITTAWGMTPRIVDDPTKAASLLAGADQSASCDVVLLDADAQDGHGLPHVVSMRDAKWPGKLVVIVPPGELEANGAEDWLAAGAAAVIEKPVSQSDLLDAVVRSLGESFAVGSATWIAPIEAVRHSLQLLVAEDIPANQKVVRSILEQRGHRVDIVGNGKEALDRAARKRYDAVLMDLRMPQLSGLEATEQIRALGDPQYAEVPIIALTAHVLEVDRERCLAARMDGFVTKPIDADELIRTVERAATSARTTSSKPKRRPSPSETPTVTAAASPPAKLNLELALARIGGDRQLLRDMAVFFREDVPPLVASLRKTLDRSQGEESARAAHSIKGLASNFDAAALQETAARIEDLVRAGRYVAARELLDRLDTQVDETCDALRRELG
jgi:two-component system sensor histidine kinase/response regulator